MKKFKALVKRSQFCEHCNKWLAERLRQALCAEEVYLTNGRFYISLRDTLWSITRMLFLRLYGIKCRDNQWQQYEF